MNDRKKPEFGAYVTMLTPYDKDHNIDYGAVEALVDWYWKSGLDGIFACCHSTEIHCLSLADRVKFSKTVVERAKLLARDDKSRKPLTVVSSGHISYDASEQLYELSAMAQTGADALIMVSNRFDIDNTGEDKWISDAERLIAKLPDDVPLGIYECPTPYKRVLTDKMTEFCAKSGRFHFIKDTCCDAAMMKRRTEIMKGTPMMLMNANAQTLLETLQNGADGYCGIMCNFHPKLYAWLCHNFKTEPEKAQLIQSFLSTSAFLEQLAYPCIAKYHINKYENIPMELYSRARDMRLVTPYQKSCVDQMKILADHFESLLGI